MFEAKQIVAAAQKYNRIVQHAPIAGRARRARRRQNREGLIGDVYMCAACASSADTIGRKPVEPVPGVHYDLCRAGAGASFTRNRFPLQLSLFLGLATATLAPGHHQVDMARWGLGWKYRPRSAQWAGTSCSTTTRKRPTT